MCREGVQADWISSELWNRRALFVPFLFLISGACLTSCKDDVNPIPRYEVVYTTQASSRICRAQTCESPEAQAVTLEVQAVANTPFQKLVIRNNSSETRGEWDYFSVLSLLPIVREDDSDWKIDAIEPIRDDSKPATETLQGFRGSKSRVYSVDLQEGSVEGHAIDFFFPKELSDRKKVISGRILVEQVRRFQYFNGTLQRTPLTHLKLELKTETGRATWFLSGNPTRGEKDTALDGTSLLGGFYRGLVSEMSDASTQTLENCDQPKAYFSYQDATAQVDLSKGRGSIGQIRLDQPRPFGHHLELFGLFVPNRDLGSNDPASPGSPSRCFQEGSCGLERPANAFSLSQSVSFSDSFEARIKPGVSAEGGSESRDGLASSAFQVSGSFFFYLDIEANANEIRIQQDRRQAVLLFKPENPTKRAVCFRSIVDDDSRVDLAVQSYPW